MTRIPDRYIHAVLAHVFVEDASAAIDLYRAAFGASEIFRVASPSGKIVHAELDIEGSVLMIGDPDEQGLFRAASCNDTPSVGLHVYVADVDAQAERAVQFGLQLVSKPQDMFYGDRMAMVRDKFGLTWIFLQRLEDVSPDEIKRRGEFLLRNV